MARISRYAVIVSNEQSLRQRRMFSAEAHGINITTTFSTYAWRAARIAVARAHQSGRKGRRDRVGISAAANMRLSLCSSARWHRGGVYQNGV